MAKSFKEDVTTAANPALPFISSAQQEEPPLKERPPEGFKLNPKYIETKSERLQLLIQPTVKAKLKEAAQRERTSVNDLINRILEKYLEDNDERN